MYHRILQKSIEAQLFKGKTILLTGARQTGKTHLVKQIVQKYEGSYYNCEIQEEDLLDSYYFIDSFDTPKQAGSF
ncbi:MAG: AAA family ATPase [Saprospiraceae bacterium]|nr:AAA family ATPase [Saprospiraceae bacterium]